MSTDTEGFRAAQRLAYDCVEAVAATLEVGTTEREACRRMRAWLGDRGVNEWLHRPFAWFGDRTAFRDFKTPLAFFPTERRLAPGMAFILDCAPIVDGYTADVGFTTVAGSSGSSGSKTRGVDGTTADVGSDARIVDRLLADLEHHRALIVELVATRPLGEVYDAVAALAHRQGHTIRHRAYPFGVLGHRVVKLPAGRSRITIGGFGARSLYALATSGLTLWNDRFSAQQRLPHGMWAVEPHLAFRGIGAKFEEILVVDDAGARWLDDDLPHVRRWRRAAEAA